MPLYILAATLQKSVPGGCQHHQMIGYRLRQTEDEARGSFLTAVQAENPGHAIALLGCMEVPAEHVLKAAEAAANPSP